MSSKLADLLAIIGFCCVVAGVYLWFGLAPALIVFGAAAVFVAAKLPEGKSNEPDQTDNLE